MNGRGWDPGVPEGDGGWEWLIVVGIFFAVMFAASWWNDYKYNKKKNK